MTSFKKESGGLRELSDALRTRLEIINDHQMRDSNPAEHLDRLAKISTEIDRLARSLPQDTHPRLLHYLERASYSKALEFLETEQAER